MDANNNPERLGFIPASKIDGTIGKALWATHKKNSAALNAAREAVTRSKDEVRAAIAKALKSDGTNLDFSTDGEGRLVLIRRAKVRKIRAVNLPDLTAAS